MKAWLCFIPISVSFFLCLSLIQTLFLSVCFWLNPCKCLSSCLVSISSLEVSLQFSFCPLRSLSFFSSVPLLISILALASPCLPSLWTSLSLPFSQFFSCSSSVSHSQSLVFRISLYVSFCLFLSVSFCLFFFTMCFSLLSLHLSFSGSVNFLSPLHLCIPAWALGQTQLGVGTARGLGSRCPMWGPPISFPLAGPILSKACPNF